MQAPLESGMTIQWAASKLKYQFTVTMHDTWNQQAKIRQWND